MRRARCSVQPARGSASESLRAPVSRRGYCRCRCEGRVPSPRPQRGAPDLRSLGKARTGPGGTASREWRGTVIVTVVTLFYSVRLLAQSLFLRLALVLRPATGCSTPRRAARRVQPGGAPARPTHS
jgi:hypothetical protein